MYFRVLIRLQRLDKPSDLWISIIYLNYETRNNARPLSFSTKLLSLNSITKANTHAHTIWPLSLTIITIIPWPASDYSSGLSCLVLISFVLTYDLIKSCNVSVRKKYIFRPRQERQFGVVRFPLGYIVVKRSIDNDIWDCVASCNLLWTTYCVWRIVWCDICARSKGP